MRTNARIEVGQVWRSSDPRRLSAFKIVIYPPKRAEAAQSYYRLYDLKLFRAEVFLRTGPKGYTRMS